MGSTSVVRFLVRSETCRNSSKTGVIFASFVRAKVDRRGRHSRLKKSRRKVQYLQASSMNVNYSLAVDFVRSIITVSLCLLVP